MKTCDNCGAELIIVGYHKNKRFCTISCATKYRYKNGLMNSLFVKGHTVRVGMKHPDKYIESRKGIGNPSWKGVKAGKKSIHEWVNNNYHKSSCCEHCKKGYDPLMKFDWSCKNHDYSDRGRENWQFLCRSCHMKYDYHMGFRKGKYHGKHKDIS